MSGAVDLRGRKALVTGGTKGIGGAVASRLQDAGAVVLATARTVPREGKGGILFVGTLEPRKGIDDLVAVWQSLAEPRPRLILCGERGWRVRVPAGVEVTGWVDRERLRTLYQRARIFVYPSRYEGFGIPPLEAMACGAPVIATRTGAIPEYAEGAALLIDAGDRDALGEAMLRLLRDEPLRRDLAARGIERAKKYRWDRSAELMTELLWQAARE